MKKATKATPHQGISASVALRIVYAPRPQQKRKESPKTTTTWIMHPNMIDLKEKLKGEEGAIYLLLVIIFRGNHII
jgi:hypothetical protein